MQRVSLLLCLLVGMSAAQNDSDAESLEILTPNGKVRGSFMESRLGKKIYSFRGLRYAEPPTGQQRFKVSSEFDENFLIGLFLLTCAIFRIFFLVP